MNRSEDGGDGPGTAAGAVPRAPLSIAGVRKVLAAHGLPVLVSSFGVQNIVRLAANLVLTRLLAPEAFGVMGVIVSVSVILQLLTDAGFHAFVVRAKGVDARFVNVIWTLRLCRSLALTAIMFFGAGALAAAFGKPELEFPLQVASFLFILEGVRSLHPMIAERDRRVSYVSVFDLAMFTLHSAATIVAALFIPSFWAIIIGAYVMSLVHVVASYTAFRGGLHRIVFDPKISSDLWRFARVVVLSSIITILISQADKVFLGRSLSFAEFGLYMLAVNVTMTASGLARKYAERVFFPLLADTARTAPAEIGAIYYASRRRITLILAFLLGGGVGGGGLLVRILFDDRYLGAGVFVSLLCLSPLFLLLALPAEYLMVVKGRIRATLEANLVRLAWIFAAAPVGLHHFGVVGLVAAFALIEAAATVYWWIRLSLAKLIDWREELLPLAVAAIGALIGYGATRLADALIAAGTIPSF